MNCYAIQVLTGDEENFIRLAQSLYSDQFHFLKKTNDFRKKGVVKQIVVPIFSGYVFVTSEEDQDYFYGLKNVKGFCKFLGKLSENDLELVSRFIKWGHGKSQAYFDGSRIVITEGVLYGLEGRILSVDKRKKRVKVKLDFYQYPIDLGYEVIEKIS